MRFIAYALLYTNDRAIKELRSYFEAIDSVNGLK